MRFFYIAAGVLSFGLGTAGLVLPLPTTPFYLLTAFCFSRSSKRLRTWFVNTKLYRKHVKALVRGQDMPRKTKLSIIGAVTLTMALSFVFMHSIVGRIVLAVVWVTHMLYFLIFA